MGVDARGCDGSVSVGMGGYGMIRVRDGRVWDDKGRDGTCWGSSNKSCMESEKASDAGKLRSSMNVRVLRHLKLQTFLQKLSIDSDEISITDFRVIFRSL